MRTNTRTVFIKDVQIGGSNNVVIQSMCNIKTSKVQEVVEQINNLQKAGCELVRLSIMDMDDANALKEIIPQVSVPLVGDIHFDYRLAIAAIENGISKIRINPGNIGGRDNTIKVIEKCKEYHVPVRIGVNSGSVSKEVLSVTSSMEEALIVSLENYIKIFEEQNFYDLVLSIKATDIQTTINANILADKKFNYPLHIGLTESGTKKSGIIRSSYALGTLLNMGIGDTIRVSLTADPIEEVPVCKEILSMCVLYNKPILISCPTCGRTAYKMFDIIKEIEPFIDSLNANIKVAIMGCVVNGPGEASSADIGIAGGKDSAVLFKKGKIVRKLNSNEIVEVLKEEILHLINDVRE